MYWGIVIKETEECIADAKDSAEVSPIKLVLTLSPLEMLQESIG